MSATEQTNTTRLSVASEVDRLTEALASPFDPREVRFKPAVVSGNRALALAYVDARVIQDRLDDVLGVTGWQDEYECLPDGSVVCRLRLRLGEEWITKMDVGGQSEQPDEGDRRKAAFSDALKRAAVKFGIGRYLYRLPSQWVDYDAKKKQFARTPTLPPSALPKVRKPVAAEPQHEKDKPAPQVRLNAHSASTSVGKNGSGKSSSKTSAAMPANGAELQRRVYDFDARLAEQGMCPAGELVKHIVSAGVKAGYEADLATWSGPAIALAVEEARAFELQLRQQKEVA